MGKRLCFGRIKIHACPAACWDCHIWTHQDTSTITRLTPIEQWIHDRAQPVTSPSPRYPASQEAHR